MRRRRRGLKAYRTACLRYGDGFHEATLKIGQVFATYVRKVQALKRRADELGIEVEIESRIAEARATMHAALAELNARHTT